MVDYWKRSRITKVMTDSARAGSFAEAEARLDAIRVAVFLGSDQINTNAGQAAALTAVATARKCFGRATLVIVGDAPLLAPLPLGQTLRQAGRRLGARVVSVTPHRTTHSICIGGDPLVSGWKIHCWWDRWLSGTRIHSGEKSGASGLALAGVFAAAVAMRQIFACALAAKPLRPRDVSVNLWEPWSPAEAANRGPARFDVPDNLWFLGLGHLGQGFVWNLCLLPARGGHAVVQDNQSVAEENEATSLLILPGEHGEKKARAAARWLKVAGWDADVIERRHHGDIRLTEDDPRYLLCGLDRLEPRLVMAGHGFEFMIDAGLGHGPNDFEGIQIRTVAKKQSIDGLWNEPAATDGNDAHAKVLAKDAYADLEKQIGQCGIVSFAEASTAVPFVGAAAGALVIAQAIRLASLQPAARFLQMELGAPEMVAQGGLTATPSVNLGSTGMTA